MSLIYLSSLFVVLAGFTVYPLISKKYIGRAGFKKFVPAFLSFSAAGALAVLPMIYGSFSFDFSYVPLLAVLGGMYTTAAYLIFYSIERHNLSVLNPIIGSQEIFIAIFTSIFFFASRLNSVVVPFLVAVAGIAILSYEGSPKARFSKYVVITAMGVLIWVFMWIFFYTINAGTTMLYYAVVQLFAFVFCLPVAAFHNRGKGVGYYVSGNKFGYIALAGMLNGAATVVFSFAYKFSALLTPFVSQLAVPIVIISSIILFKERPKKAEVLGIILLTAGSFIYIIL